MQATTQTALAQRTDVLRVEGVRRSFGKATALDDLSLTIPSGEIVGLLGRNGAGKSTLLRIVSGQLKPNAGEIQLDGEKVFDNARALGQLCLIGDTPDFGQLSKIKDFFWVCQGLFPGWDAEVAEKLVDLFELPRGKRIKSFSRGMQTALMLTVGLASNAQLTVFDEPSLGLDAVMRERFYDQLVLEKQRHAQRTFVLSTHLIEEVARVLDSALLIDAGRLLRNGTIAELTEGFLSVSGDPQAVRELTDGMECLKEDDMAGTLVRHVRLNDAQDKERIEADDRVRTAPVGLQRLFVFLTEQKEAERHAADMV